MDIKFCKKCILPSTKPDLEFNDDGLCQGCVAYNNRSKKGDNVSCSSIKELQDFFNNN